MSRSEYFARRTGESALKMLGAFFWTAVLSQPETFGIHPASHDISVFDQAAAVSMFCYGMIQLCSTIGFGFKALSAEK